MFYTCVRRLHRARRFQSWWSFPVPIPHGCDNLGHDVGEIGMHDTCKPGTCRAFGDEVDDADPQLAHERVSSGVLVCEATSTVLRLAKPPQ